ncbi:MAG TPA: exodeoxyribonuclease VII large subunit, partial [Tepidisphaeraceae bacterium]
MTKENFFDFREKMAARPEPPKPGGKTDPLTVSQLTVQIERAVRFGVPGTVYVCGEVSNLNRHRASGHLYFTLKDANACIDCVMFNSNANRLKFTPTDGIELLATGNVGVYGQRGKYQLYTTSLQPLGKGALELAFKQLRERLQREGLFDADRKKPLPAYPTRIAIVTSRSTAALQDV